MLHAPIEPHAGFLLHPVRHIVPVVAHTSRLQRLDMRVFHRECLVCSSTYTNRLPVDYQLLLL